MERCRERLVLWLRRLLLTERILDENKRRRTLLVGSIIAASFVFIFSLFAIRLLTEFSDPSEVNQESLVVFFFSLSVIGGSFYLLRRGLVGIVSIVILFLMLFCCLRASLTWGIDLYTVNIMYPLIILLSAMLLGRRFAFLILLLVIVSLVLIFFLHQNEIRMVSRTWRVGQPDFFNLLTIILAYSFMSLLAWITVRELEKSLLKAHQLNFSLEKAKSHLQEKVEERTQSLEKMQLEQLLSISAFVELGKLSAGLLHDIRQPLSVLHLLAARYKQNDFNEALAEITTLLSLNQRQTNNSTNFELFSLQQEIAGVVSLFKYKLDDCSTSIVIQNASDLDLYADRAVFHKVLANLLMNAIESLSTKSDNRTILISWKRNRLGLKLFVKDFGVGISQENQALIFTPRFSSKGSLGLGLYLSNQSMREIYGTAITFRSELNRGSVFTMYIKNKFIYE
jgi:two-component system NtrC family sensor kinase